MARRKKPDELKVYGRHACAALFKHRPEGVAKVFLLEGLVPEFGSLLKHCAAQRIGYRIVETEELERVADSRHHEGICIVAKRAPIVQLSRLKARGPQQVIALDGVDNPHNVGAILRSAAHFGASAVVRVGSGNLPPSARRNAEGGAEAVPVIGVDDLASALQTLAGWGYRVLSTSGHRGEALFGDDLPQRVVWLLGSERDGVSPEASKIAHRMIRIPGTGAVESLNVSVAAALLLAEYARRASHLDSK